MPNASGVAASPEWTARSTVETMMRAARPDWFEDAPPTKGSTDG